MLDMCICYFLNWKYFSDIWKNNPSLWKPKLKHLLYCQVFWVLYREFFLTNVSKIVLVLLWFQIIGKTIKTVYFHNNTDLLYQSWPTHTMYWVGHGPVKSRCVIQRRIQNPVKYLRWSVLRKQLTTFSR